MHFFVFVLIFKIIYALDRGTPKYHSIDGSQLLPIQNSPGFWDNREKLPSVDHPRTRLGRIVGGVPVVPHSHPYQVLLLTTLRGETYICGGSILSPRSILTAAHCAENTTRITVVAGVHNRLILESSQQRQVVPPQNYRMHQHYNTINLNNDIAILILPGPLTFNNAVQPVRLPLDFQNELFVGNIARAIGWGETTNRGGSLSSVLKKSYNLVMTNEACIAKYGNSWVIPSVVCVMQTVSGICGGDSGGVLSVQRGSGRPSVQIGIASFKVTDECSNYPAGFTRVTSFLNWIMQNRV